MHVVTDQKGSELAIQSKTVGEMAHLCGPVSQCQCMYVSVVAGNKRSLHFHAVVAGSINRLETGLGQGQEKNVQSINSVTMISIKPKVQNKMIFDSSAWEIIDGEIRMWCRTVGTATGEGWLAFINMIHLHGKSLKR